MDLMIVVAIHLRSQDRACFFEGGDVLVDTRSDNPVLQPAVGSFDLAFGLRRESVGHIHSEDAHHSSPLRISIIGLEYMLAPNTVSSLDEAKDTQRIDVVAQGEPVCLHEGLGGLDMGPGGLLAEEISE